MIGKFKVWLCRVGESGAVAQLESELYHCKEVVVPKLERELEVLRHEKDKLCEVIDRDRRRIEAETAAFAKKIVAESSV